MNEFLTFITQGIVEFFEEKQKDKYLYLSKIVYYSIAIIFAVFIIKELIIYFQTESIEATIIGRINYPVDKNMILFKIGHSLILPIYSMFAFWFCLTHFDYKKVALSFSIILSTLICFIIHPFNILPHVKGYNIAIFAVFIGLIPPLYLLICNMLPKKVIEGFEKFWNKRLIIITYAYVIIFTTYMLYFTEMALWDAISNIIISVYTAFMLIYVRRLLGYTYTIILHYILLLPLIATNIYMLINSAV